MQYQNDSRRCLTVLDQDSTLIAVIEMSLSSRLVAGISCEGAGHSTATTRPLRGMPRGPRVGGSGRPCCARLPQAQPGKRHEVAVRRHGLRPLTETTSTQRLRFVFLGGAHHGR
jgi:hypothetical protein